MEVKIQMLNVIKRIPLWAKLVSVLLICLFLFELIRLPGFLEFEAAYRQGRQAEAAHKYITAAKAYEHASQLNKSSAKALAGLAIAYYYNGRIEESHALLNLLNGKRMSKGLRQELNILINKIHDIYYISNDLKTIMDGYGKEEFEKTSEKLEDYTINHTEDAKALFYLGNLQYDLEKYSEAKISYQKAIQIQPELFDAYLNLASAYRQIGDYKSASTYCDKVLEYNLEYASALASKAKVLLAEHKDLEGLRLSEQAYSLDSENLSIAADLVLAYHYNNMAVERDRLLKVLAQKKYEDIAILQEVIEGKRVLRK